MYLDRYFPCSIIGVYGVGPKYLVDEYAVLDSRYWVTQDATVMMVSLTEFYVMAPLCIFWYVPTYVCDIILWL